MLFFYDIHIFVILQYIKYKILCMVKEEGGEGQVKSSVVSSGKGGGGQEKSSVVSRREGSQVKSSVVSIGEGIK